MDQRQLSQDTPQTAAPTPPTAISSSQPTPQQPVSTSQPQPLQNPSGLPQSSHGRTWMWVLLLLLCLMVLALCAGYFILHSHILSASGTPSAATGIPTAKVTDLAPDLPMNQKSALLVQHSDSSREKILIPTTLVSTYTNKLTNGDRIVSVSPAQY